MRSNDETTKEHYFLKLFKDEKEVICKGIYEFTADQFCGTELGSLETQKSFVTVMFSKHKDAYLALFLEDDTVIFKVRESDQQAKKLLDDWKTRIENEFKLKEHWIITALEGNGLPHDKVTLHITERSVSITLINPPHCLRRWDLNKCINVSHHKDILEIEVSDPLAEKDVNRPGVYKFRTKRSHLIAPKIESSRILYTKRLRSRSVHVSSRAPPSFPQHKGASSPSASSHSSCSPTITPEKKRPLPPVPPLVEEEEAATTYIPLPLHAVPPVSGGVARSASVGDLVQERGLSAMKNKAGLNRCGSFNDLAELATMYRAFHLGSRHPLKSMNDLGQSLKSESSVTTMGRKRLMAKLWSILRHIQEEDIYWCMKHRNMQRPCYDADYLNTDISYTLMCALRGSKPRKNILGLSRATRDRLVCKLHVKEGWEILAEHIGMSYEEMNLVEVVCRFYNVVVGDVILQHWQLLSDKSKDFEPSCTKKNLVKFVKDKMPERQDILTILENDKSFQETDFS
ncbi:uncharacterized protein LOC106162706 isoform X2 [Lingula anatina]|nr:uncharacterized protein LOC106162706 isoform X2 [Lingula anatina]|eukprot:XP_013395536.1 uncharacterized protein LOC106162706 isoform X2 [Lingula anatina]